MAVVDRPADELWLQFARAVGYSLNEIGVKLLTIENRKDESSFGQIFRVRVFKPGHKAPDLGHRIITVNTSDLDAFATHHEGFFIESIYNAVKESYIPFKAVDVIRLWGLNINASTD